MIRKWWDRWRAVSSILKVIQKHNRRLKIKIRCGRKALNDTYDIGGTEALTKDIAWLIRLAEQDEKLNCALEKRLKWGIRVVATLTGQVMEPRSPEIGRLRFASKEETDKLLESIVSSGSLEELEWRVVDLSLFHESQERVKWDLRKLRKKNR